MDDMFICEHCGRIKSAEEIQKHKSFLCHIDGSDYYEDEIERCECGGDFLEATPCEICGENYLIADFITTPICKNCISTHFNLDTALKVGNTEPEKVTVNGFLQWMLDEKEIDKALIEYVKKYYSDEEMKCYIDDYLSQMPEKIRDVIN